MPVYNAKSIPAEVHSSTKDPEVAAWEEMLDKQCDPAGSKDRIHPQAVARAVSDFAARDAVFVFDTGLNTLWSGRLRGCGRRNAQRAAS